MKKKIYILLILIFAISCEDPIPSDFEEKIYVEAYLLVGEPIKDINVFYTKPISDSYDYDSNKTKNMDVVIIEGENRYRLEFENSYCYPDTNYKIKPETLYELEITLSNGDLITGKTTTPKDFSWVTEPDNFIYYPLDTINRPANDSLKIEWTNANLFYLISISCIDTLDYGKYLVPQNSEMNRRIYSPIPRRTSDYRYRETATWSFMPTNKTPVIWNYFKWFGKHEIAIYNPDPNFLEWALQYFIKADYDPLLGSVKGGIGVFGSASVIRDTTFLVKNQP